MANTFTPIGTGNTSGPLFATGGVPLPGSATMSSGGVTVPTVPVTSQSYGPIQPLPIGGTTGTNSTAI